jgi:hypothetical protein
LLQQASPQAVPQPASTGRQQGSAVTHGFGQQCCLRTTGRGQQFFAGPHFGTQQPLVGRPQQFGFPQSRW